MSSFSAFAGQLESCLEKVGNNNFEMKQCVLEEFTRLDKSLNAEYQKLMTQLKKDQTDISKTKTDRVIKNQRAWITMRDTTCDVEAIPSLGGHEEGLLFSNCRNRMTKARTAQIIRLQKILNNEVF